MSCALGEKLRPGTWDAGLAGRWAGGARELLGGSAEVGEGLVGSVPSKVG